MIPFFLLLHFSRSWDFLNVQSQEEITAQAGGQSGVLELLYQKNYPLLTEIITDLNATAKSYQNIVIVTVDCTKPEDLLVCPKDAKTKYPVINFYPPGKTTKVPFTKYFFTDAYYDFIAENSNLTTDSRPPRLVGELTRDTLESFTNAGPCQSVFYYKPFCSDCEKYIPDFLKIVKLFSQDNEINFAFFNCFNNDRFCIDRNLSRTPTFVNHKPTTKVEYRGERRDAKILEFINARCNRSRGLDGLLREDFGLIPKASAIVEAYFQGDKKALEKLKQVEGAEKYVKILARVLDKGNTIIKFDIEAVTKTLNKPGLAPARKDDVNVNLNILKFFEAARQKLAPEL